MRRPMTALALGAIATAAAAAGDQDARDAPQERFRREMAAYEIRTTSGDRLELRPEPILHWNNPARNGEDGAMFVWTRDGRPEVVGTAFTFRGGNNIGHAHELHSLSEEPLAATTQGTTGWTPKEPGLTFRPLERAPKPAETEAARLIQMRTLARSFEGEFFDAKGVPTQLRLVPQPLLRYAAAGKDVADGTVFSFAVSTDPEIFLVLEARGRGAKARWEYAFARFHFRRLRVTRDGKAVWEAAERLELLTTKFGDGDGVDEPYIIYRFPYTPADDVTEQEIRTPEPAPR